jgi:hypothetical protein
MSGKPKGASPARWKLEVFATDAGLEPFTRFADRLSDFQWAATAREAPRLSPTPGRTVLSDYIV